MISNVDGRIKTSNARLLFERAKGIADVIDLTLGDPDFPTPQVITDAGCKAIIDNKTHYTSNSGIIELRSKVAEYEGNFIGKQYDPEKNVIITVGAMGALYLTIKALVNPNDEVLICEPYWINYVEMVQMINAKPVVFKSNSDFRFSCENLINAITNKTKLLILNSPSNPTGKIIEEEVLEEIVQIAREHNLWIISDEAYRDILINIDKYTSIARLYDRTILINSFSKKYAMTGWRVGYALGDESVIQLMTRMQENLVSCCPQVSQYAALSAITDGNTDAEEMRKCFVERANYFVKQINDIPGFECAIPDGSFYLWIRIPNDEQDSLSFSLKLLEKARVAVVPGCTYGAMGDRYIRVALTKELNILQKAIERIRNYSFEKRHIKEYEGLS